MDNNLRLGQDAYYVTQEKVYVVKIISRIVKQTEKGTVVKYEIQDYNGRTREVSGAYLISDFEAAKQISIKNWNEIFERVAAQLQGQKKITFKEARQKYEKAKKKAEKERKRK